MSSKQLTAFSDFRLPRDSPDHLTLPEYVRYLELYVQHFNLRKRIHLDTQVKMVERKDGLHLVTLAHKGHERVEVYRYIAVCSGLHVTPNTPHIPGIEHIPESIHSSDYKKRAQIAGKKLLILGCGETAMDVAYQAVKAGCPQIVLSQRGGFLSFPKVLNRFKVFGKSFGGSLPIDGLITNLFETAYVHPRVAESRLRWHVSDFVLKRVLWFLTGTSAGCNQYAGELPPHRQGRAYVFLNKSHAAMTYINRPYKKQSKILRALGNEYTTPIEDNENMSVDLAPFVEKVDKPGLVHFQKDGRKESLRMQNRKFVPDMVIFCTGYTPSFAFLSPGYPLASEANLRNIIRSDMPDVAFIGFVRPGVGAIPPISEMQAMWWTALLQGKMQKPSSKQHYRLLQSGRIDYGVDHSAYISTLGKDIGSAPGLWELCAEYGPRVLLAYCFGAAFVPFYRMIGPFRQPQVADVVTGELTDIIKRRGYTGNLMMGVIPMIFYGIVNLMAFMIFTIIDGSSVLLNELK